MGALEKGFVASQPRIGWITRVRGKLFGMIPFVAWAGSLGGILFLADSQPRQLDYPGLALVTSYSVAAPVQARLDQLLVREQCRVKRGQAVAHLDGADLELRARRVRHGIAGIRAEMARERELHREDAARAGASHGTDQRRFLRDVESAQLSVLELMAKIEEDRIRLQGLRIDLNRDVVLASQDVVADAQLNRIRTDHDALRKRIQGAEVELQSRKARLRATETRQTEFQQRHRLEVADMDKVLSPFQWRIQVQDDELEMIALARARLTLRAPAAGRIDRVFVRPGELLINGQPVVSIVADRSRALVAFVPLNEATEIRVGMTAILERSTMPGAINQVRVSSIGAAVEALPAKLLTIPGRPEWGVPIYLDMAPELATIPGEPVRVRIVRG